MKDLFYSGGPLFMGILTLIAAAMLALAIYNGWNIFSHKSSETIPRKLRMIKELGLLALVTGVLATSLGLFAAFDAIQSAGDISLSLMAGGLKVAMITIIYGFFIYILSLLIWFVLSWKVDQERI